VLGLPKSTELHRPLPKKTIYEKFQLNTAAKEKIDADISRLTIVNEISSARVNIAEGEKVKVIYLIHASLKRKDFDAKVFTTLSKLIGQNIVFVAEYNQEACLVLFHTRLMQTPWSNMYDISLPLSGLNLDLAWENIVKHVGQIQIVGENTLEEQIELDEKRAKLEKEIARLEKQAWREKQPRKKFELVERINRLKKGAETL
jgi:hypothetical protein